MRKNVVIGFLGTNLDGGKRRRWRLSVQIAEHPDFPIDRFELIYSGRWRSLAEKVKADIERTSPETEVLLNYIDILDPWDFEEMYGAMYDFARDYGFDDEREEYHIHLTTGTHVGQICWFLLAEARHVPAKLVQTGPPREEEVGPGSMFERFFPNKTQLAQQFQDRLGSHKTSPAEIQGWLLANSSDPSDAALATGLLLKPEIPKVA